MTDAVQPAISLLAIDLDGTLVVEGDRVSAASRDAVRRAARELQVVIATGRRYRTTQRVLAQLELALPVVCLGGALTKGAGGETLYAEPFAPQQIGRLLALARRRGLTLVLQRDAHAVGGSDFVADDNGHWNSETRRYLAVAGRAAGVDAAPEETGYQDVLLAGCFGEREALAALRDDIAGSGGEFATVLVESKKTPGWYLETTLGHVNKWSGLSRLAARLGIATGGVCAVGDALNDLPMIEAAGLGVAMGNAEAAVRDVADWVTASNQADGVAALVERLLG